MQTETKQTATLYSELLMKFSQSHRKKKGGFMEEYAALVPGNYANGELKAVVTLRIYGTAARNTACLWTHGNPNCPEHFRQGSGEAGGCGFHRPSAAAQEAIQNAGFVLSRKIDSCGDEAMREAVLAIAAAIGFPEALLHVAHA